jgi:glycosyltransferase Alg8
MNAVRSAPKTRWPQGTAGFLAYTSGLFLAASLLPATALDPSAQFFLAGIGVIAMWRYSWGAINFTRSLIYRNQVFPHWRYTADKNIDHLLPSKLYILMTIYRIDTKITTRTIKAAVQEAIRSGLDVTLVASIVEKQDEFLVETIFQGCNPPDRVNLKIIRATGSGKRVGLAHGFMTISRDRPPPDALVVVMDGDTVLLPDCLKKTVPFFKLRPKLGALTTDEICEVDSKSHWMKEWYELRFAQRHILMSSISLSKRVMTLTGRMSIFRADIVTSRGFIDHITHDMLDHWRLGQFKFLTGDDKSSLYWVIKQGYEQLYIPDVQVLTLENPAPHSFLKSSTQLMFRWFGNMFRTNSRIVNLGLTRMPPFVWWAFFDQRLSMWTTLIGPVFATLLAIKYGAVFFAYYFVWVGFVRWVMSLMLLSAHPKISWRYPFLLYYSQVYGALVKTWVFFRLDVQSWTKQKTKLQRGLTQAQYAWNSWSSHAVHATALIILICATGLASQVIDIPFAAAHSVIR